MRLSPALLVVVACSSPPAPRPAPPPAPPPATPTVPAPTTVAAPPERVTGDTPRTTSAGHLFVVPDGWTIATRDHLIILAPPEGGDAQIALVDVAAATTDEALRAAWQLYKPTANRQVRQSNAAADRDGWTDIHLVFYETAPSEARDLIADVRRAGGGYLVTIFDLPSAIAEKRVAAVRVVLGQLLPKGGARESFTGKTAHELDAGRIAELGKFVERAQQQLGVPGVAIGLYQNGKVVFAGGFGVRELGSKQKVDGDTLFMIASNTKALTTLMLAKLVDDNKLTWETLVTELLPTFKLGDAETTKLVEVKHLICACTGLPRQDFEMLLQSKGVTAEGALATLATVQPTSKFGEIYQYSNLLATAGGYVGGHVAYPKLELGAAYDKAMQTLVFTPLGMTSTTFDTRRALRGNHAMPHAPDVDGKPAHAVMEVNAGIMPYRPAGAAWSSARDMLRYIAMELAGGTVDGKPYISKDALLARRAPQVAISKDATYGMGLMVDHTWGVTVVHHGGDLIGFHSDMMWLPEHGVGAIVLTNGDPGWRIRDVFQRKLLEVLFDGKPLADADIETSAKAFFDGLAVERARLTVPADPTEAGKLAGKYHNAALGDIVVIRKGGTTVFDFGEFKTEVASRKNVDGSISFVTIVPGFAGLELVVRDSDKRTLIFRDAQHEYVFTEA